ncbi:MAG: helix-turn-helix domain-containing protein [Ruminococcus sp.]|nr:helix-turn-helix domain-containing protein [Ruminococcus sp.]
MDCSKVGNLILQLRKEQGLTQRQLADALHLSDKTISKWERGLGCPDVTLLRGLSSVLQVDLEQLLSGTLQTNQTDGGNMKRIRFYVCPDCGNILTATGEAALSCCGRKLEALAVKPCDEPHTVKREQVEDEWYITFSHPMTKQHYISFFAVVACDRVIIQRLYPEQSGELRLPMIRDGSYLFCCNVHGIFRI